MREREEVGAEGDAVADPEGGAETVFTINFIRHCQYHIW